MVKHDNKYVYLSGNKVAAIMLNYLMSIKEKIPQNGLVFNSVVSSDLGLKIAKKYGLHTESTLTGFKYTGDKIQEYKDVHTFVFGYEESIGY